MSALSHYRNRFFPLRGKARARNRESFLILLHFRLVSFCGAREETNVEVGPLVYGGVEGQPSLLRTGQISSRLFRLESAGENKLFVLAANRAIFLRVEYFVSPARKTVFH